MKTIILKFTKSEANRLSGLIEQELNGLEKLGPREFEGDIKALNILLVYINKHL